MTGYKPHPDAVGTCPKPSKLGIISDNLRAKFEARNYKSGHNKSRGSDF